MQTSLAPGKDRQFRRQAKRLKRSEMSRNSTAALSIYTHPAAQSSAPTPGHWQGRELQASCVSFMSPAAESHRVLSDLPTTSNVGSSNIAQEDILQCLNACRSQRNLAGRLVLKVFSPQERLGSNCRGICGKRAFNSLKVRSIQEVCLQHYPLQRLKTASLAEKEMRTYVGHVQLKQYGFCTQLIITFVFLLVSPAVFVGSVQD